MASFSFLVAAKVTINDPFLYIARVIKFQDNLQTPKKEILQQYFWYPLIHLIKLIYMKRMGIKTRVGWITACEKDNKILHFERIII